MIIDAFILKTENLLSKAHEDKDVKIRYQSQVLDFNHWRDQASMPSRCHGYLLLKVIVAVVEIVTTKPPLVLHMDVMVKLIGLGLLQLRTHAHTHPHTDTVSVRLTSTETWCDKQPDRNLTRASQSVCFSLRLTSRAVSPSSFSVGNGHMINAMTSVFA